MSRERILNQQIQRPPYKNTPPHKKLFSCFQKQEQNEEDLEYLEKRSILSQVVDEKLTSNYIKTHKYTWINFIPLNLCDQFSKLANIYFLFIGILQMIPSITISDGKPVMYMPLTIVLVVSALKDLFEDLKKYKQDQEENQRQVTIIDETKDEKQVKWQHLRVGNIVKISQNEQIPADLVVLSTSDKKGLCYLETQNLDGETNLKRKEVPRELINPQTENNLRIQRFIHCEFGLPDPYIYHFNGSLSIDFGNDNKKIIKVPIDDKNFLLRGCTLKNTEQIYGLVVYTGQDTKIMRNSIKQRPKHSSVEKFMNICITVIFTIQMIVTFISSAYASYWVQENIDNIQYLGNQETNVFIYWGTWVLIYTNFVPISLIVSLEMVKFIQAIFIGQDKHMYCYKNNIKADAQCSNVNEELGQIEYVFSDKTGTLTQNLMNFTNLIVNGRHYGEVHTISQQEIEKKYGCISNVKFFDGEFIQNTRKIKGDQESRENLEALLLLSICNTVQAEEKDGKLIYNAESPDELSLINFAKLCGVEFEGTDENNIIKVKFGEKQMDKYQLLHKIEFNSARKRMSVIIQDLQTDKVILYCKGADNIILERTIQEQLKSREIKKTQQTLNQYSTIGLRTLLLAKKEMTLKEFQDWYQQFNTAKIERASQMEIHQLEEQIEENLTIIGATAIEDELRDDVGSTIKTIKDVGINFWVLTGDKLETAINIGISCQVLTNDQKRFILQNPNHPHQQTIKEQLEHIAKEIEYNKVNNIQKLNQQQKAQQYALIVPGDALIHISKSHEITQNFVKITQNCSSVIACRVSPIQKQEIVKMVRQTFPQKSTLAIGDGANDVNMITAAHVGVGIKGVEGLQAASLFINVL
ncbi:P-type ATPase, cytoplasmic domain N [Pseudocohnilembus persalinus]|uniref:Phospholipid-transporting ATPase n=1 Tax=Pseudocohnilembus persalinus TaxID=266149 RepID=A0A0V0QJ88_PSEPJ|nr:P-type ATPase, cytoplasmic domain N [Pseudocohnilembus persalinus]|eukprot:KRX02230.1 P-type ATPase, cytoplasmic domain N [Pseudocohnilembus persalinus]